MDTNRARESDSGPQADLFTGHDWAAAAIAEMLGRLVREADFVAERWRMVLGTGE